MKKLNFTRTLPCDDAWDVIVVGGGPAGCAAAAASAREGARTLLIEATGSLGGMGTNGLIPAWCPFSDGKRMLYRGLGERVFNECKAGMPFVPKDKMDWAPIDYERLKRIYDNLVTQHGATVLFHSVLSSVEADGKGNVKALIISGKRGLRAYKAKVYVDCTGDGDLAVWAGAESEYGDGKGGVQPSTHCFMLSHVNMKKYSMAAMQDKAIYRKIAATGRYPLIQDWHTCNNPVGPGTIGFNSGHIWDVDGTDPECVSKALMHGRQQARQFRDALAEFLPEIYAESYLASTGALMGIRESRRVIGDYVLTLSDYLERQRFQDDIGLNCYAVDIHSAQDETEAFLQGKLEAMARFEQYKPGESHGIPYRCLIPRKLKNVLMAGRFISCTHEVQASVRVMPVCLVTGEAAGLAAGLAAKNKLKDVRKVNVGELQRRLREEGARLT